MRTGGRAGRKGTSALVLLTAISVGLAALFFALPALADPPGPDALPVKVLAVKSDDAFDQAEALTQALRKAVRDSVGWSLGEGNQSLEFLALQMKCSEPIDAACEARIADVIQADRFLWATLTFTDGDQNVTGSLNFFQRGQGTSQHILKYSANLTEPTDDFLVKVAKDAFAAVSGGAATGTLVITAGGVAGQLFVDGKPFGALAGSGGSLKLPSGDHAIAVKAQGYADAQGSITVRPNQTAELRLQMVALETDEPVDMRMVGGFVGLGVGVAAGAVGLWSALEVNSIRNDDGWNAYRSGFTTADNACEEAEQGTRVTTQAGAVDPETAKGFCDDAKSMELIQAVTFPVAAVAAGVGAYLLGTSSLTGDDAEDEPAAWRVEPMIGPHVQSVNVSYRF